MLNKRIKQLQQTNREQRDLIDEKNDIINNMNRQFLNIRIDIHNKISDIINIGHSNDINKTIKILDIAEKLEKELFNDIKIELDEPEKLYLVQK